MLCCVPERALVDKILYYRYTYKISDQDILKYRENIELKVGNLSYIMCDRSSYDHFSMCIRSDNHKLIKYLVHIKKSAIPPLKNHLTVFRHCCRQFGKLEIPVKCVNDKYLLTTPDWTES